MRKNKNLPSLQLHKSSSASKVYNSNQPKDKDNVKVIESRISKHESQIERNQKVIISLTNQFRLIRQELKTQQNENQQLSEMFRKVSDENQKLLKTNKQFRNMITRLEKNIEDSRQRSTGSSKHKQQVLIEQFKILQQECRILKQQLIAKKKQVKVSEATSQQLIKQNQSLKVKLREFNEYEIKLQKTNNKQKQQIHNSYRMTVAQLRNKVNQQKQIIAQLENQNGQVSQLIKDRDNKSRQLTKNQLNVKQLKQKLNMKCQQLKFARQRVSQLEGTIKKSSQSTDSNSQLLTKIKILQFSQAELQLKLAQSNTKIDQLQKNYNQQLKKSQNNEKKLRPIKKLIRNKATLERVSTKVKQSIICEYCNKMLQKPVTNIPCGHSYCFDCKKGYEKDCKKCSNVKREAVYRNQLMDEIIEAYKAMKDIIDSLSHFNENQY